MNTSKPPRPVEPPALTAQQLAQLPALPVDVDGPVFAEPWQAQAFALAVSLREDGVFSWSQWCAALNAEISAARAAGDPDLGDGYYHHWLRALEALVTSTGLLDQREIEVRKEAWDRAQRATPHGEPIALDRAARAAEGGR